MERDKEIGSKVRVEDLTSEPEFWGWFDEISKKTANQCFEIYYGCVDLVRTETPIEDPKKLKGVAFGSLVHDDLGWSLEQRYKPRKISAGGKIKIICLQV